MSRDKFSAQPIQAETVLGRMRLDALDKGLVLISNPEVLDPTVSLDMESIHFEAGGIRRGHATGAMGDSLPFQKVRAIHDHLTTKVSLFENTTTNWDVNNAHRETNATTNIATSGTYMVDGLPGTDFTMRKWDSATSKWQLRGRWHNGAQTGTDELENTSVPSRFVTTGPMALRTVLEEIILCGNTTGADTLSAYRWVGSNSTSEQDSTLRSNIIPFRIGGTGDSFYPKDVIEFADRAVFFGAAGNYPQYVFWSSIGNTWDWNLPGAGNVILRGGPHRVVDEIKGGSLVGSNLAVFRERSIVRGYRTGNASIAIGFSPWIEGVGTDSQFSIAMAEEGTLFLGHDRMVYFLTDQNMIPVGRHIHEYLKTAVRYDNMYLVQAVYDPILQQYHLGIPEDNATNITGIFTLDFGKYLSEQRELWTFRSENCDIISYTTDTSASRFSAAVSNPEIIGDP